MPTDSTEVLERLQQDVQRLADANRELAARLDAEAHRSRMRRYLAAALAIGCLLTITTTSAIKNPGGQVVVARQLVLTDDLGHKRGSMFITNDGQPCLEFFGHDGNVMLELLAKKGGFTGMKIYDNGENNRLKVGSTASGDAGLAVYDGVGHVLLDIPMVIYNNTTARPKYPLPDFKDGGETDHF